MIGALEYRHDHDAALQRDHRREIVAGSVGAINPPRPVSLGLASRKVEKSDVPRPQARLHPLGVGESRDLATNDDAIVAGEDSEDAIGVALDEVGHAPESPRARSAV